MPIKGTVKKDWAKIIPVNNDSHVTQTNNISRDGYAVHITNNIRGTQAKVQDRFDASGNYLGSNFGKR